MGTFTVLGASELGAIADDYGLGPVERFRAIAAGTINSNFEITTPQGVFFVRVNEGKSEIDVAWESRLVGALAAGGVITPPPIVARDGRPYAPLVSSSSSSSTSASTSSSVATPSSATTSSATTASATTSSATTASATTSSATTSSPTASSTTNLTTTSTAMTTKWVSVFPWRPGRHLAPDEVTVDRAATFGGVLAELHRAGLELPADWRRRSIYDHDHLVGRFATIERVDDPALAHAKAILADELAVAAAAAPVRRAATHGIIHGDLFRDNVLWDGERISAVLDFEQASGGSLPYDIAVCINDWCWTGGAPRLDLAAALLSGYQRVRPLTDADRAALPVEIRASAARFTLTRITDVYLAKVSNPEKDFRAFLARVEAWRGQSLGALTSSL